jgi:1-acyl-sn-glycerol-3-phosphate acyltransferase
LTAIAPVDTAQRAVQTRISPWLAPLAMVLTQDLALPVWFRSVTVLGQEHLPRSGPLLLAPTHKARWDALLLPYGAGRRVSGRDCRFMVTLDEMQGLQGWFLRRLGCFPVNQARPSLACLRHAVDLLQAGEQLVVFPEGRIRRDAEEPMELQQGLARLAALAAGRGVTVPVLPVGIAYDHPVPLPCDRAVLSFGAPMQLEAADRDGCRRFTVALAQAMEVEEANAAARLLPQPLPG